MAKAHVKFNAPADMQAKTLEAVEVAKAAGGVRKGTNETTKAIERGEAKLVVIAEDVTPEEIVMHLPILCQEKNIPYTYVAEKLSLGKAAGLGVPTAAIAITKPGASEEALRGVLVKVRELVSGMPKPAAEKKEAKPPAAKKAPAKKKEEKPPTTPEKKEAAPAEVKKE
ncbi:50S ribosomal protein L7ae [Candidatus Micrarchaeota archaeon]|nr:50S ribosomal protein L7ae [Candidatus Micrarchaeota archaeon]MBI5176874.1 50S ribosomal protein L7ae [Candidatus Micrarchaeota archaeon]